ncbi:probable C-mannosyltransferase DPY19L1 [Paramacrobiotus metropolitanus]|uniref:probable C-mannosyltransferase DPY19L1 n=1 Tax=Paramacrobiotus metropolitanus TaxID=2943436 RepID=UPI002445EBBD|nr:probable C-mannosyltransferase DPY19L1 [Paramacrobiotus metropolitanus]
MIFRTEQMNVYMADAFGVLAIVHTPPLTPARNTLFPKEEVNFINRFSLNPGVFLAGIYFIYSAVTDSLDISTVQGFRVNRGAGHSPLTVCVGLGNPFYLYLLGVNGSVIGLVLCLTGWLLIESFGGGVIAQCTLPCFLFNHGEAARVMWTPPMRESFGYPFFVVEMPVVAYLLKTGCRSWQLDGRDVGTVYFALAGILYELRLWGLILFIIPAWTHGYDRIMPCRSSSA